MSYKWTDKKTSLCYKGRYFRDGDKIPSGILADERIKEFIRLGKIESDKPASTVSKTETVAPAIKPAKSDDQRYGGSKYGANKNDDGELK